MKYSYFSIFNPPITNLRPNRFMTMAELAQGIKEAEGIRGQHCSLIDLVSKGGDYKTLKARMLPWFMVGGVFSKPNLEGLVLPSCMFILDVDGIESEAKVEELKQQLFNDSNLNPDLVFTSPSGLGVKAMISYKMPLSNNLAEYHKDLIQGYMDYYDETYSSRFPKVDRSGCDITRRCFMCHDDKALYREIKTLIW